MDDDDLAERIAIKLTMAADIYPDTELGRRKAKDDAIREHAEEERKKMKSAGYEQRRMF